LDDVFLDKVVASLDARGVELGPGLSDTEIDAIEARCDFRFPPDLRAFLQRAHPLGKPTPEPGHIVVGGPFPDWRTVPDDYIQQRFEGVLEGVFFDIQHGFWDPEWGAKPFRYEDACDVARQELAKAPKLIPVFAHRLMPNEPLLAGNPVFSFHQTDIIYYGFDLADYFAQEFDMPRPSWATTYETVREIPVWTRSLEWRYPEFWPEDKASS